MTLDPQQAGKTRKAAADALPPSETSPLRSNRHPVEWPGRLAVYPLLPAEERLGFQETWTVRVLDAAHSRGLLLRFRLLTTENGFQRQILTRAVVFSRNSQTRECLSQGFSSKLELVRFQAPVDGLLQLGENRLDLSAPQGPWNLQGSLLSKGVRCLWDLNLNPGASGPDSATSWIPLMLHKGRVVRNRSMTLAADWKAQGFCQIQNERWDFENASTEVIHEYGPGLAESWSWGHCASFVHEDGRPAEDLFFEGCTQQLKLGLGVHLPRLSTFAVRYQGTTYRMDSLWDSLRSRVDAGHHHWKFHVDQGDLSFRGEFQADSRDFAGLTEEDCDGSLVHVASSLLSKLTLRIYRKSQLECTVRSEGGAALEFGTRTRNPYIRDIL
jgi:hypothetical protein